MIKLFFSSSEKKTKNIANEIFQKYKIFLPEKCLIFALEGEIGTGKTIFAKGIAEALDIRKVIRSPSFIIEREFNYKLKKFSGKFVHIDLWRVENQREIANLKIEKNFKPGNVVVIEWAEKIGNSFKKNIDAQKTIFLNIKIDYLKENERRISVSWK